MSTYSKAGSPVTESLDVSGFAIIEDLLSSGTVADLREAMHAYSTGGHDGVLDRGGEVYGGRDLLWRVASLATTSQRC
jgi:hypothetical protein